jgi:hypothetical protein
MVLSPVACLPSGEPILGTALMIVPTLADEGAVLTPVGFGQALQCLRQVLGKADGVRGPYGPRDPTRLTVAVLDEHGATASQAGGSRPLQERL